MQGDIEGGGAAVTSPWVVGAVSYVVDLSKVRVEAEGKLRGLPNTPPLLSFLLAVRSRWPSFVLAWPALVCISRPLLVVAVGVPHPYSLTFAGPRSLPHLLACIGLRPCWPGPSLLMPSFTLACQLHRHSHPPTHLALTSICARLSSYVPPGIDRGCCCCHTHTHSQYLPDKVCLLTLLCIWHFYYWQLQQT
jgi:hypothetical protein